MKYENPGILLRSDVGTSFMTDTLNLVDGDKRIIVKRFEKMMG